MAKLNQIIAVTKGIKSQSERELTNIHHAFQKAPLMAGISRVYRKKDEDGDDLPSESTLVQIKVEDMLDVAQEAMTKLFDIVSTMENGNQAAQADIVVDGKVLVPKVPVTVLLFLEKQLNDIHTFVMRLPTLDPSEEWNSDDKNGVWKTDVVQTTRTKKVPRNHTKAEATDKHPAQVELYYEDQIVGTWNTVKFSGALPAARVTTLLDRVETLQAAVKFAREAANSIEVNDVKIGDAIFGYLFAE